MRLWHSKLIPVLDGKRLCDLHMSCCNLRGLGWGKKNRNIDYIYSDPNREDALAYYHELVLREMDARGYNFDICWMDPCYCGKRRPLRVSNLDHLQRAMLRHVPLYAHNLEFFKRDVRDLRERGLELKVHCSVDEQVDQRVYEVYEVESQYGRSTYGVIYKGR